MRFFNLHSISFFPFYNELRHYSFSFFRNDLLAALAVSLMTIPQSIAYSLLANLPPMAGLFSAIFGTIFTAAFGSSKQLISGPSTGIAILLQTSIANILYTYYPTIPEVAREELTLHILMQFVTIMGIIQIGSAFFNVSKLLQFVSRPVILGYFAGITIAIAITQAFSFIGISPPQGEKAILYLGWYFLLHLSKAHGWTLAIGTASIISLFLLNRFHKNWPNALFTLIAGTLLAKVFVLLFHAKGIQILENIQISKALLEPPFFHIRFPILDITLIPKIFPAALALSFLSIIEVFSISRAFAAKSGESVFANQDTFAVGVGNCVLAFISGAMPTSGSASRTALNVRLHAKTRFAAILSGLATAVGVFVCWPLIQQIPLAALAALLIATVHTIMDWNEIKFAIKATRADCWVFFLTFFSCLLFNLDVAFFIGIIISIGSYLKKSATPHLVEYAFNEKGRLVTVSLKNRIDRQVRIIGIGGDLYFATADVFQAALESVASDKNVQAIVLRLNNVYHMDASMCLAILHLYESLHATKRYLVISGLTEEVWQVFHRTGMAKQIAHENLYFTDESNPQFSTWKACLRARELIHGHDAHGLSSF